MVIVGSATLSTSVVGFPAIKDFVPDDKANSFSFTCCASGGVPGHIGTSVWPGEGCQLSFCALKSRGTQIKQIAKIKHFIPISTVDPATSIASLAWMDYPPTELWR